MNTENVAKNFVWAKMKYCSVRPAKICECPPNVPKPKKIEGRVCVYFYGTWSFRNFHFSKFIFFNSFLLLLLFSSAWISKENVFDYLRFKSQFANKNRTASFQIAIKEIEDDLCTKQRMKLH